MHFVGIISKLPTLWDTKKVKPANQQTRKPKPFFATGKPANLANQPGKEKKKEKGCGVPSTQNQENTLL